MIITCVLKKGLWKNNNSQYEYTEQNVLWMKRQLDKFIKIPYEFICLSDVEIPGVKVIKLKDNMTGWWSKIELFREFDECFYLDLDTVIVGNIDHILTYHHKFTVLRNISGQHVNRIASGLMAWNQDLSIIYKDFMKNPQKIMQECRTAERWGDQGFIKDYAQKTDKFQDLFPNEIVSFKHHLNWGNPNPENNIVLFHGYPKPQEVKKDWIIT